MIGITIINTLPPPTVHLCQSRDLEAQQSPVAAPAVHLSPPGNHTTTISGPGSGYHLH